MWETIEVTAEYLPERNIVGYEISYTTQDGVVVKDHLYMSDGAQYVLHPAVRPMHMPVMSHIDMDERRIIGIIYLVPSQDGMQARVRRKTPQEPHEEFNMPGGLPDSGPDVYPVPIKPLRPATPDGT